MVRTKLPVIYKILPKESLMQYCQRHKGIVNEPGNGRGCRVNGRSERELIAGGDVGGNHPEEFRSAFTRDCRKRNHVSTE